MRWCLLGVVLATGCAVDEAPLEEAEWAMSVTPTPPPTWTSVPSPPPEPPEYYGYFMQAAVTGNWPAVTCDCILYAATHTKQDCSDDPTVLWNHVCDTTATFLTPAETAQLNTTYTDLVDRYGVARANRIMRTFRVRPFCDDWCDANYSCLEGCFDEDQD